LEGGLEWHPEDLVKERDDAVAREVEAVLAEHGDPSTNVRRFEDVA
jgi:hypothetical protein